MGKQTMDTNTIHFLLPEATTRDLYQEHIGRYVFASGFVSGKLVLDVACGVGYGSRYLYAKDAKNVVGGDLSKDAMEYAQSHYARKGVQFVRLEATNLPFPDSSFDVIVSLETIEHIEGPERFLSECNRLLKENGILICSTPNKGCLPPLASKISPFHVKEFYPKELLGMLTCHFTCITLWGQMYRSHFGHYLGLSRNRLPKIIGQLLSKATGSMMIKTLLKNLLFKDTCVDPHRFEGSFDQPLDKRYEISPFQNTFWRTPFNIVATAKKCVRNNDATSPV